MTTPLEEVTIDGRVFRKDADAALDEVVRLRVLVEEAIALGCWADEAQS